MHILRLFPCNFQWSISARIRSARASTPMGHCGHYSLPARIRVEGPPARTCNCHVIMLTLCSSPYCANRHTGYEYKPKHPTVMRFPRPTFPNFKRTLLNYYLSNVASTRIDAFIIFAQSTSNDARNRCVYARK